MNKKELAQEIQKQMSATGITTKQIEEVITHATDIIREAAITDRVVIHGFGVFRTANRAAKTGRNPQTGEPVQIPARTALTFKSSK